MSQQVFNEEVPKSLDAVLAELQDDMLKKMELGFQNSEEFVKKVGSPALIESEAKAHQANDQMIAVSKQLIQAIEEVRDYYKKVNAALGV